MKARHRILSVFVILALLSGLTAVMIVPAGATVTHGIISGRVTCYAGYPVVDASISVWDRVTRAYGRRVRTDHDGYYTITGLAARIYEMGIQPPGESGLAPAFITDIVVTAGETTIVDVTLAPFLRPTNITAIAPAWWAAPPGVLRLRWRHSLQPNITRMQFGASPAIADLDINIIGGEPNSDLEIVTGSDEFWNFFPELNASAAGIWRTFDAQGNIEWARNTLTDEARSSVAIVDIDGDGFLEIAGGTTSGWNVQVMDRFGNFIWTFPYPSRTGGPFMWHSSPAVADINPHVSGLELVVGNNPFRSVWAFDGDNSDGVNDGITLNTMIYPWATGTEGIDWDVLWIFETVGSVISSPAIGDIDNDGDLDVVFGCGWHGGTPGGSIYALDGRTGALLWVFQTGGTAVDASAALADFDGDRDLEVVIGSNDGRVYFIDGDENADGIINWDEVVFFRTGGPVHSSAAVGDLDRDGRLEIVIGSTDGKVYTFRYDPVTNTVTVLWTFHTLGAIFSSPALVSRDGDGTLDIFIGSDDGHLYLIDGRTGRLIDKFYTNAPIRTSPSVADVDGDGMLDIFFTSWNSDDHTVGDIFWSLEDTGSKSHLYAMDWPMFRSNTYRTGTVEPPVPKPAPDMAISPTEINYSLVQGTDWTEIGTISVMNIGEGTLVWSAQVAGLADLPIDWLRIAPAHGTVTEEETDKVTVWAHSKNLMAGVCVLGIIRFTGAGETIEVGVVLAVFHFPYLYGFSFRNRSVGNLNTPWCEVTIFRNTFYNVENLDPGTVNAWISKIRFGTRGNCYGVALAALMEYAYPRFDQFLEKKGEKHIYCVDRIPYIAGTWTWDARGNIANNPTLMHIVGFQISQTRDRRLIRGPEKVKNRLKNLPERMYMLGISDRMDTDGDGDKEWVGHALVPFRFETARENQEYEIYVYDPNHPGDASRTVIIRRDWLGRWYWKYYMWENLWWSGRAEFTIRVECISEIARQGTGGFRLPGTRGVWERMYSRCGGEANLLLRDSEGRVTGLKDGVFVEEIPYITLFIPEEGALLDPDEEPARWQPAFYVSEDFHVHTDGHLTIIIEETENAEEFSFIKFGKDFFVKYEAATGKEDIEVYISYDGTEISIANQENRYNLTINRNIDGESLTFYAIDIPITPEQIHQVTIQWDVPGEENITLEIDTDGDGIVDYTITADREITRDTEGVPPALTYITVTPSTLNIHAGETHKFTVETMDQFDNPIDAAVTWSVDNETVGTIDATGRFTAIAEGTVTVTATSVVDPFVAGTATVTVKPSPYDWVIVAPHPVPAAGAIFWLNLPEETVSVTLKIFAVDGRLLVSIELDPMARRYPTVGRWGLVDRQGRRLGSGLYIYLVKIVDSAGRTTVSPAQKMVIDR